MLQPVEPGTGVVTPICGSTMHTPPLLSAEYPRNLTVFLCGLLLVCATGSGAVTSVQALDYEGLVAYWHLDGSANDLMGSHPASFEGNGAFGNGPVEGTQAAVLDGSTYLRAGSETLFDSWTPFSATAWIQGPSAGNDSTLIGRMMHGGTFTGWELHVGASTGGSGPGRLNVWLIDAFGSSHIQVNSPDIVLDDTWHHVAFTYDGSGIAAGVRIYVDGQDATGETTSDTLFGSFFAEQAELNIGARMNGAAHLFTGTIGQVSLWERLLSPAEIQEIFTDGIHPPVLVHRFDATPASVFAGTPATLSWDVLPGATLSIDHGIGDVTASTTDGVGSIDVLPEVETTYTLSVQFNDRTEQRQVRVMTLPLTTTFTTSTPMIAPGTGSRLEWTVHPGATVLLNPGSEDVTDRTENGIGFIDVAPSTTTDYTLVVTRQGIVEESTVRVLVAHPPSFDGLVSLWPLNSNTADVFGGNNGTFVENPAFEQGPRESTGAAVLGGSQYIRAGDAIALDTSNAFSVTAWIKGPLAGNDSTVIGRMIQGGSFTGWELHVGTSAGGSGPGRLNVWLIDTFGSSHIQVNSPVIVLDDTWHHVAFTYDGSGIAAGVRIYVDGLDATGEATSDTLFGSILATDTELNIGARMNGANHIFTGEVHEVSVWERVLLPEEMAFIHLEGIHPPVLAARFEAHPSSVFAGMPTTLEWEAAPDTMIEIEPDIGDVTHLTENGTGSIEVSPTVATTYVLTATRDAQVQSRQATVSILPLIEQYSGTRTQLPRGHPLGLTWSVHPEATLTLTPGPGNVDAHTTQGMGSIEVIPVESTPYTLRAEHNGVSLEASWDVIVLEPPWVEEPPMDQLLGVWTLDGHVLDGHGDNHGTFFPEAAYTSGPNLGKQAAQFDGTRHVRLGSGIGPDTHTPFSVTAWVRGPAANNDATLVGRMRQGSGFTGWELHVGTTAGGSGAGLPNVWLIHEFGPNYIQVNSPVTVLDDTWHHVAFTYDGSSFGFGVNIYVDGHYATGTFAADSLTDTILADDAELNIGTRMNGANHGFRGALYEVSIWSTALSGGQVADIFLNGIPVQEPPASITLHSAGMSGDGVFRFEWNSSPGRSYRVETALTPNGPWNLLAADHPTGGATESVTAFTHEVDDVMSRFYRVQLNP